MSNIVLCVRSQFITYTEAIGRLAHIARELVQTKHINYLRASPANNRYKVLSEYNDNGHMREANDKNDEIHDKRFLEKLLKEWQDKFKADYNAQIYTSRHKSGKIITKHKHWRSDMVGFNEIIISFGTDRVKQKNEGLNVVETQLIDAQISFDRVERFVNAYCAKHGVKCLMIAEHNDEKTKHYQILLTNYNFEKHANLRFNGKDATRKAGKELQDMGAVAFKDQAIRGKSSKEKHKSLAQMHEAEQIFKDEQQLKAEIRTGVTELLNDRMSKINIPILGKFYKLTPENKKELLENLTEGIFEVAQSNINIISDEYLKEQIQILTKKILEQDEIIKQTNAIKDENEELKNKLEQLKDSEKLLIENTTLKSINENQANEIKNLQDSISSNEAVVNKAKSDASELKRLKRKENKMNIAEFSNKRKDDEMNELKTKLQTYSDQSELVKTQTQEIKQKESEISTLKSSNQKLTSQNKNLVSENSALKAFKDKVINFLSRAVDLLPQLYEMIKDELPEINVKSKDKNQLGMEI